MLLQAEGDTSLGLLNNNMKNHLITLLMKCSNYVKKCIPVVIQNTQSQWLTLHMAIISLNFRGEKSAHNTQALFQTLKSELKFPWETQPHHPFLHASTRHVDWPKLSPMSHFLFCHLFKTICFPHVCKFADSHSVCHANKGSPIADYTHVNINVIIQTNGAIQSLKHHIAFSLLTSKYRP